MKNNANVLIDASWWVGGNRERGIGQYLAYYFEYVYKVPSKQRVWLFPAAVAARERADFCARFGGRAILREESAVKDLVSKELISSVLISSPFERPWSLLQWMDELIDAKLPVEAILFDLLPLDYPEKILHTWPESEQKQYEKGVKSLGQVSSLLAISPYTAGRAQQLLKLPAAKISILKFGLTPAWLRPPVKGAPVKLSSDRPLALTISAGEWRKNLDGTLTYFAQKLASTHQLAIICRLGLREHLRFRGIALQLDIYPLVRFLGRLGERDKWRYLYSTQVFLFLSHAEGLGIPLLEARAAGIERIIISQALKDQGFAKLVPGCEVMPTPTVDG